MFFFSSLLNSLLAVSRRFVRFSERYVYSSACYSIETERKSSNFRLTCGAFRRVDVKLVIALRSIRNGAGRVSENSLGRNETNERRGLCISGGMFSCVHKTGRGSPKTVPNYPHGFMDRADLIIVEVYSRNELCRRFRYYLFF